jgi:serine phosphatase RsbU (regulator of sigma subunit)
LAIEASTVLENARLLEEERAKRRIEEELGVARRIQQSLLPRRLPDTGWFRVCGPSRASHEVGGDYFDMVEVTPEEWSLVIAVMAERAEHGKYATVIFTSLDASACRCMRTRAIARRSS